MDREFHHHQGQSGHEGMGMGRGRPRRPVTDYGSTLVQWMRHRGPRHSRAQCMEQERPSASYIVDLQPPHARPAKAADTIPARHLHTSLNKIRHPINVVLWTPEGRRLLTASSSGEFTLWNGMGFNFETIMQAHDNAIRAAQYSHSNDWLISADQDGIVKYWQPNFNNVKAIQAHNEAIRGMAIAPTDSKFVTAADDSTLKIFDFAGGTEESTLTGHQWELRCVDWHPTKGLIVSGSKDHTVKLWDPRTGRCLTTLIAHKNQVSKTVFEPTRGELLATSGRDHVIRIFDLRMMRDVFLLRGHEKDVTSLAWHPVHRNLLSSGGNDGALHHYLLDEPNLPDGTAPTTSPYDNPDPSSSPAQTLYPAHSMPYAHEFAVWTLAWHPLGHILTSGSNDRVTRFWTRPRPGEKIYLSDRYHIGQSAAEAQGTYDRRDGRRQLREEEEQEAEDEADGLVDQKMPAPQPVLPGLPGISISMGTGASPLPPGMVGHPPVPPILPSTAPFPPPPPPNLPAGKVPDLSTLMEMFGGQLPPIPPPGGFPPPPQGFPPLPAGMPPPPNMLPPGFPMPGFPPPPPMALPQPGAGYPVGTGPGVAEGENGGVRRRTPLPSQQDSLKEEMKRGKFRTAR
ncbi:WD40 repeat-like protein [Eremomyces bilateralis CBS 781.70]|uniref:Polyadenylation factor subunit 2 n=1 Tax=Eremomyces bilateralis CBS 781.70 TaxID=1392243 RepID=A0A6G1FSM5_9PEZI|nr:WD40 repeat-like protein [Eremomyces bilateralis CBS 781.70]KAF1808787.1 WD40 repeat-like protein [Eremomyces bilateralis CBS 781.70]